MLTGYFLAFSHAFWQKYNSLLCHDFTHFYFLTSSSCDKRRWCFLPALVMIMARPTCNDRGRSGPCCPCNNNRSRPTGRPCNNHGVRVMFTAGPAHGITIAAGRPRPRVIEALFVLTWCWLIESWVRVNIRYRVRTVEYFKFPNLEGAMVWGKTYK